MESGDRHRLGRAASRAVQRSAARRRAHVLEPARLERIRRNLGKPGVADPLLPGALRARHGAVLQHPLAGRIAARRGLLSHGRGARRLFRAARRGGVPGLGRHARHPQDARSIRTSRSKARSPRWCAPPKRSPSTCSATSIEITANPVARQVVQDDPARRGPALRLRLGLPRAAHAATLRPRNEDVVRNAVITMIEKVELNGYHSSWLAPDSPASRAEMRSRRRHLGGRPRRHHRGAGEAGLPEARSPRCASACRTTGASRSRCSRTPRSPRRSEPDMHARTLELHAAAGRAPLSARCCTSPTHAIRAALRDRQGEHWNPDTDMPWAATLRRRCARAGVRAAARRVWSRRAWVEYTGLAETPALLIRFCLEPNREVGSQVFPHRAQHRGGLARRDAFTAMPKPAAATSSARPIRPWEPVFNRSLYRDALDAELGIDGYVCAHCAFVDGLEYELDDGMARTTPREPVARAVLERCLVDSRTPCGASAGCMRSGVPRRCATTARTRRGRVGAAVAHIEDVEFAGYHCVALATGIDSRGRDRAISPRLRRAGLGATTADEEVAIFRGHLTRSRARVSPTSARDAADVRHPRLGVLISALDQLANLLLSGYPPAASTRWSRSASTSSSRAPARSISRRASG